VTIDEAVEKLDAINASDPEAAHGIADEILLSLLPLEVNQAYTRLVQRCRWWASA
jgi:hypothetical protein